MINDLYKQQKVMTIFSVGPCREGAQIIGNILSNIQRKLIYLLLKKLITVNKCYDEETKSTYKVDSHWLSTEKCERRICTRQKNSKTPIIKTMK